MKKHRSGFTIVELLIVIVVIAILATISVVAYNGVQQRARNSSRAQSVAAIQKGLELYRAERGRYPSATAPGTNLPSGFTSPYGTTSGYSYSVATDDSWLRELRLSGFMPDIPKDPVNNNTSYFIYYASTGIGSCQEPVYALIVIGWEGELPENSQTLNCSLSGVVTAGWIETAGRAVFSNLDHPTGS
jgi:prepilin-type N-terminal cleavage/methylation domain-containing protein